jgi:hypothetical protein
MRDKYRMRKVIATKALRYESIEEFLRQNDFVGKNLTYIHKKIRDDSNLHE